MILFSITTAHRNKNAGRLKFNGLDHERTTMQAWIMRVFGEMVALMWARGYCSVTVRLEHLWTEFCQKESFALFCAYPRTAFTEDPAQSIAHICATHSKVLAANNRS
jgi:hypothetical protein